MTDSALAPGCFGSALTYSEGSSECRECAYAAQCAPASALRLASLRAKLGIAVETIARPVPQQKRSGHPAKVQRLLDAIADAGINVTAALQRGSNPFDGDRRFRFLRATCHLLLRHGAIERPVLIDAFMRGFKWSEGTAVAYVAQARQVLEALGAIVVVGDVMQRRIPNE